MSAAPSVTAGALFRRAARLVVTAVSALVFLLLVLVAVGSAFGWWRVVPVRTGSMDPFAPQGSAVVVRPVAASEVKQGDVIVFSAPEGGHPLVVHRVYAVHDEDRGRVIQTKGDANDAPDPWQFRIRGDRAWVVAQPIPHVGQVLLALDDTNVRMAVMAGGALVVLLFGLTSIWGLPSIRWRAPEPTKIRWRMPGTRRNPVRSLGDALRTAGVPAAIAGPGAVVAATLVFVGLPAVALFTSTPTPPAPVYATGVLNAPSPLSCTWTASNNVQLAWTNTSPGFATGYKYLRSNVSGSGYGQIGTTSGESSVTGNDTNPAPPTTRYYVVQSTKSTWTSANSNEKATTACTGAISTMAGTGTGGFTGDNGRATSAQINGPRGMAVDSSGNVYFTDSANNRVRKINTSGVITTFAGGGANTACSFSGAATSVSLNDPRGVTVDSSGNVYIADGLNNCIRKVTSGGTVSRLAGGGATSACSYSGAGSGLLLNNPKDVAVNSAGDVYVADTGNNCIRKITSAGTVSRIAGGGATTGCSFNGSAASAVLAGPTGVTVSSAGVIYISDTTNNCIRQVNGTTISLFAGTGANAACSFSGSATSVNLVSPGRLETNASGHVFFVDSGHHCVRRIVSGTVGLVAGTGTASYSGDGGAAIAATVNDPSAPALEPDGDLLITDTVNDRIRRVVTP